MKTLNKRQPNYGGDAGAFAAATKDEKLLIYKNICRTREFDLQVIEAVQKGRVIAPVYLSLGQEALAAAIADIIRSDVIFAGHRAHDLYICLGADVAMLRDELLGLPTGTSGGRAGSSCLKYMKDGIRFMPHHGLIGEQVPQAIGAALASNERVVTIFGDGAAEEDYVLESLGFAATRNLPVLFICEDNDLSILTKTSERRSWEIADVAKAFGIQNTFDLADDPWTIREIVQKWDGESPMIMNCRVCRERWHSGIGQDGPREWERNRIVREQLLGDGLEKDVLQIEKSAKEEMWDLWNS